jgi:hypothetical protein
VFSRSELDKSGACAHMTPELFEMAAKLFLHPLEENSAQDPWVIPGLKQPLKAHQALAVAWIASDALVKTDGFFVGDEMGMGKSRIPLALYVTNLHLSTAKNSCIGWWKGVQTNTPHHPLTGSNEGPCPSQDKFGVQCPCVKDSVTKKLQRKTGPTLLLAHKLSGINTFLCEWEKAIDQDYHFHGMGKMKIYAQHAGYAEQRCPGALKPMVGPFPRDRTAIWLSSRLFIVTTPLSYKSHVRDFFRPREIRDLDDSGVRWAFVFKDEFHKEFNLNTTTLSIVLNLRKYGKPAVGCFSGTPWETTLNSVINWMKTFYDEKKWNEHQTLRKYNEERLAKDNTRYVALCRKGSRHLTSAEEDQRAKFVKSWGTLYSEITIARNKETLWPYHNECCVVFPKQKHNDVRLRHDDSAQVYAAKAFLDLQEKMAARGPSRKHDTIFKTSSSFQRFCATYPAAARLRGHFSFTAEEIKEKKWYRNGYVDSPYRGALLNDLISHSAKLNWLKIKFFPPFWDEKDAKGRPAKLAMLSNIPASVHATSGVSYSCFRHQILAIYRLT